MHEQTLDRHQFDVNEKGEIIMGKKTWKQLAELQKSCVKQILTPASDVEKRRKKTFGPKNLPQWTCQYCDKKFETNKGKTMHMVKTHNYRVERRRLVQEVENGDGKYRCLMCRKIYASKQGAQLHLDKHCARKFTVEEIVNMLGRHGMV